MSKWKSQPLLRRIGMSLTATVAALLMLMVVVTGVAADTVTVTDSQGKLDASRIRNEASSLPNPVDVFMVYDFKGSSSAFDSEAKSRVKQNSIVIAIDVTQRHVFISGGSKVKLKNADYQNAQRAFVNSMRSKSNDYTTATVEAINSMKGVLSPSPLGGGSWFTNPLCCVGILLLGGLAFFAFMKKRRPGGGFGNFFNRGRDRSGYPSGDYPPGQYPPGQYPPGQYPPGYDPRYGPGYRDRDGGGMNPWVAGGLGAAAGGLIGYGLGSQQNQGNQGDQGDQGTGNTEGGSDFGGGGGDWGNSGGGDFGGGGGDWGGGGDFGGGDW